MDLLLPDLGLFFWTLIVFLIVLFILSRQAWNPISNALENREQSIQDALDEANKAREEINNLKAENDKLIQEAKVERDRILKEARETKDQIISDAREEAQKEAQKIKEEARKETEKERAKAFQELKGEVADIAMDIASQILRERLEKSDKQEELIQQYIEETNTN